MTAPTYRSTDTGYEFDYRGVTVAVREGRVSGTGRTDSTRDGWVADAGFDSLYADGNGNAVPEFYTGPTREEAAREAMKEVDRRLHPDFGKPIEVAETAVDFDSFLALGEFC